MEAAFPSELVKRVRHAADADAAERPMAVTKSDVPWAVEAVTASWLDAWLGTGAGQPRIVDVAFSDGTSGSSVRGSITAIREGADDLRLFAKSYPHFENRVINILSGTALAEGHFYTELRPLLDIETPLGYHASYDLDRFRAIVIIENIASTRGASFCNRTSTISRPEIESALRLLGKLHGQFLNDSSLQQQFPWLIPYEQWSDVPMAPENAKAFVEARDVIPARLHASAEDAYARYRQLRSGKPEQTTIIHSDVHLGNWYKTQKGTMGLCDWQCLAIGDPMRDISY